MSALARALLDELGPDELRNLAELLRPYLASDDGWLGTAEAAKYAGCTVPALRHAMAKGEVEFEQACPGGKTWLRRSELDRWRQVA